MDAWMDDDGSMPKLHTKDCKPLVHHPKFLGLPPAESQPEQLVPHRADVAPARGAAAPFGQ
jgi:hypothetical protein